MSLQKFDQFLETSGPGGDSTAKQLRLAREDLLVLHDTYGELIRLGATKARILAVLGQPNSSEQSRICYLLPSKPDYEFIFAFDASEKLVASAYVSRHKRFSPGPLSANLVKELRAMGASYDEVRTWYGEPDDVVGWWPVETWTYGALHFDLRLGIVI